MDTKKFNSLMALHGDTNRDLARFLGISESQLYRKRQGKKAEFTQSQIALIKQRYALVPSEVDSIFFNQ